MPEALSFVFPHRVVGILNQVPLSNRSISTIVKNADQVEDEVVHSANLDRLGILEDDHLEMDQRFPIIKSNGVLKETLAACEMVSIYQQVP